MVCITRRLRHRIYAHSSLIPGLQFGGKAAFGIAGSAGWIEDDGIGFGAADREWATTYLLNKAILNAPASR